MISVLIPVFNEEDILESSAVRVHQYLDERKIEHEIVVVSNGSTDGTDAIGARIAAGSPWFRFFTLPEKGVGTAFSRGVKEARAEFIVSLDADLSFDLRFLDYANDLLRYADMVVGSKTMGKQRRSLFRVIASQSYLLFTQLLFDLTISDYSIGCKAYRKSAVVPALAHLDTWTGYVFELSLYLSERGKKIIQIGVDCDDRRKSHFNLLHEGVYRYAHMFRCYRALRSAKSWINRPAAQ